MMLRRSLSFVLLGCFAVTVHSNPQASSASAKRITYTFQGTANGSMQRGDEPATDFANESFTITAIADPTQIVASTRYCKVPSGACKILSVPALSASISVGGATATFTSPLAIFDNQTYTSLGLTRARSGDLLDLQSHPAFASYDLKSDLAMSEVFMKGRIGTGQFNCRRGCVETNLGVLTVESVQNVSFAATVD
jgi:hypothetical protein